MLFTHLCYTNLSSCCVYFFFAQVWECCLSDPVKENLKGLMQKSKSTLHHVIVACRFLQSCHKFLLKVKPKLSTFSWPRVGRHRRWFSAILSRSSVCFPSLCRATHRETTVKPCWCSAEGKINRVTSLQLLLQTSVRNHETTAHTLKLRDLTSVSVVTAVCPKPNQAKCSLTPTRRPFRTPFVCFHVCFVSFDFLFFYEKCYLKMFSWMWNGAWYVTADEQWAGVKLRSHCRPFSVHCDFQLSSVPE